MNEPLIFHHQDLDCLGTELIIQNVKSLFNKMGLTIPYVLKLYSKHDSVTYSLLKGYNDVGGPATSKNHPVFSNGNQLDFHTDGTLEPIGNVCLSALTCINPAKNGGETFIIRTSKIIEDIEQIISPVLEPLFSPNALRRHSTIDGRVSFTDGPVFEKRANKIIGRYCITKNDEWMFNKVKGLKEAKIMFEELLKNSIIVKSKSAKK